MCAGRVVLLVQQAGEKKSGHMCIKRKILLILLYGFSRDI